MFVYYKYELFGGNGYGRTKCDLYGERSGKIFKNFVLAYNAVSEKR